MASAALPLFFPSVRIGDAWYGDGGIRLAAPLSPALHLGASRILAISTRFEPAAVEASRPGIQIEGYPRSEERRVGKEWRAGGWGGGEKREKQRERERVWEVGGVDGDRV